MLLDDAIAITLYSLTKYSAIVAEIKGYFGILISNNQLDDGTHAPSEVRMAPVASRMFSWASTPSESVFGVYLTINWWMRLGMTLSWKLFEVSRLAIEMVAMNNHASTKSCCKVLWCCWLNSTIKKMCSTINQRILLLEMFRKYSTPSRYRFKNRSTINWKSAIEVEATINLNALKIVWSNLCFLRDWLADKFDG